MMTLTNNDVGVFTVVIVVNDSGSPVNLVCFVTHRYAVLLGDLHL